MPTIGSVWGTGTWGNDAWELGTWATAVPPFKLLPLTIHGGGLEQLQPGHILVNQEGTVVYTTADFATDNVILRADGTGFGSQSSSASLDDDGLLTINQSSGMETSGSHSPIFVIKASNGASTFEVTAFAEFLDNVAIGKDVGIAITTARDCVLLGSESGRRITTGVSSMFLGTFAGTNTTTGTGNTFVGTSSGRFNIIGINNCGIGASSLRNVTADKNTGVGTSAGRSITSGTLNTFVGHKAGFDGSQLVTADNSIAIGETTFTTADNQVVIGNVLVDETNLRGLLQLTGFQDTTVAANAPAVSIIDPAGSSAFEIIAHTFLSGNMFIGSNGTGSSITDGVQNTVFGKGAGASITGGVGPLGSDNTLVGFNAGTAITTAVSNMLFGSSVGVNLTTGSNNTLIGVQTGSLLVSGGSNTCIGDSSGRDITITDDNTLIGKSAGLQIAGTGAGEAEANSCFGTHSGRAITTGSGNVFAGYFSGHETSAAAPQTATVDFCIGIGNGAITTGDNGIAIGEDATAVADSIAIGKSVTAAANQVILGPTTITQTLLRGDVTIEDGHDIILNATVGTKIADATGQKLGFWGKAPTIQPAAALQGAITNNTGGTGDAALTAVSGTGDDSTINVNLTSMYELQNAMRDALVLAGIMKGGA